MVNCYPETLNKGYRVYDSNGIASALTRNVGGLGGYTGLYVVYEK